MPPRGYKALGHIILPFSAPECVNKRSIEYVIRAVYIPKFVCIKEEYLEKESLSDNNENNKHTTEKKESSISPPISLVSSTFQVTKLDLDTKLFSTEVLQFFLSFFLFYIDKVRENIATFFVL